MNNRYDRVGRLRQAYHDIRQPPAEVLALAGTAVPREVFRRHRKSACCATAASAEGG